MFTVPTYVYVSIYLRLYFRDRNQIQHSRNYLKPEKKNNLNGSNFVAKIAHIVRFL